MELTFVSVININISTHNPCLSFVCGRQNDGKVQTSCHNCSKNRKISPQFRAKPWLGQLYGGYGLEILRRRLKNSMAAYEIYGGLQRRLGALFVPPTYSFIHRITVRLIQFIFIPFESAASPVHVGVDKFSIKFCGNSYLRH